jgi:exopolysaccharide biosynthesis WecB/TagA/CpsF family protein
MKPAQRLTLCELDPIDLEDFLPIAAAFGSSTYGYIVTPNVDHLIRLADDERFRAYYREARYALLDSRFVGRLLRFTQGVDFPICTGSDLTARLFSDIIMPDDRIVLVGGDQSQADELKRRYRLHDLHHHNPPMGFSAKPEAVRTALEFVEAASPFRFCFLAVGAPQQEKLASALAERGHAKGLALCIGASIDFITGRQRRAPRWMQRLSLEWLHRLLQSPRRLAGRYLIRGPRIFGLLRRSTIAVRTNPGARR